METLKKGTMMAGINIAIYSPYITVERIQFPFKYTLTVFLKVSENP